MKKSCRTLSSQESKALDKKAQDKFGVSTLILMENAGSSLAEEVLKVLGKGQKKVAIFCGKGNNGGDGFVAARHLLASGIKPDIFLAGKISEAQNEAKINLNTLLKLKQKINEISAENLDLVKRKISKYNLIIDALLGVGLKGEVRGAVKELIKIINASRAYILSVDVPSGLDATTGKTVGSCIKADKTVTFVAKKRGMVMGDGPRYCGKIVVRDLGIPL